MGVVGGVVEEAVAVLRGAGTRCGRDVGGPRLGHRHGLGYRPRLMLAAAVRDAVCEGRGEGQGQVRFLAKNCALGWVAKQASGANAVANTPYPSLARVRAVPAPAWNDREGGGGAPVAAIGAETKLTRTCRSGGCLVSLTSNPERAWAAVPATRRRQRRTGRGAGEGGTGGEGGREPGVTQAEAGVCR